jgi:hypothetical protein
VASPRFHQGQDSTAFQRQILVLSYVDIEQSPNHLLILRVVLLRLFFEKVDTGLTQPNGDLDLIFFKRQLFGGGEGNP